MKTITFYSYKGGVGRSLTLANMATRLAEFGKSVCMIDFDLEAPGLHLKFENEIKEPIRKGLVDYIHSYAKEGILPDSIKDYSTRLRLYNNENVYLIPAGDIAHSEYWRKLSSIDWYNLVYENPNSISFFLDLKQKIKKELQPDFLLIDSRTGISEMSGITISLLADEVIVVSANNRENLEGSKRIITYLLNEEKSILGQKPKVSFVLSRIPYTDTPAGKGREQRLIAKIQAELPNISPEQFFILHSDRELELVEEMKIGYDVERYTGSQTKSVQITKEYLALFEHITAGVLTNDEKEKFDRIKKAERLYNVAMSMPGSEKKIELLNAALQLNEHNADIHFALGRAYIEKGNMKMGFGIYENLLQKFTNLPSHTYDSIAYDYLKDGKPEIATEMFLSGFDRFPGERHWSFYGLGQVETAAGRYEQAIEFYEKAQKEKTEKAEYAVFVYNALAHAYRCIGNYDAALENVFYALAIDPEFAIAYTTLAEIYAMQGKINEFYLNLEIALGKDVDIVAKSLPGEELYARFVNEERFIKLLDKYDVPLPRYEDTE
jgi:MinD-like ATPase involved in chromosome partitioning or flagellar assembly